MRTVYLLLLVAFSISTYGQKIQSPDDFLGYSLGSQFTPHYKVIDYFKYIAASCKNTRLEWYGKTNEGRPLLVAFVGSDANMNRLEEIRHSNLSLAGIENGDSNNQPVIVWLSYNVHGNEAVSTEAAMKTLYSLANPANAQAANWLKNTLVIIDPCINPDGRERYLNFYNPIKNSIADAYPNSREHIEPWPGGRTNHYYFDLNRDWAWQTQLETQQRLALYSKWLPQIHVDFHEQGYNSPYYFAPAAEPFHQDITKWQKEFQTIIGKNHAKYFDKNGWLYFTRQEFDLLYPSYGDTYPTYNGSIGMTYEQGGIGAGLRVKTASGDTLNLTDRIAHHFTTGISTIETASAYATKALQQFKTYFTTSRLSPPGQYKTYLIKSDNLEKLKSLTTLLTRNGINFGYGTDRTATGYNYFTGKTENFKLSKNDLVITAYQPKSVLLKVLFEPKTAVSDSVTYDITAWALPYAYGLQAYASTETIKPTANAPIITAVKETAENPVAYISNWNAVADVRFLSALLKNNILVRYTETPFESAGNRYNAGSLIITRTGNEKFGLNFYDLVKRIASQNSVSIQAISSGFADKGYDLGSEKVHAIKQPRVAIISGEESSSQAFGEIWHYFEQQINYPASAIRYRDLDKVNYNDFDVFILPNGTYEEIGNEKMLNWIKNGGKLIALQDAIANLAEKKGFGIKLKEDEKKDKDEKKDIYNTIKPYENRERERIKSSIPGAIYKLDLDNTHPLAFGYPNFYYTLKLDENIYQFLPNGWNIGVLKKNNYVSGFVGTDTKKKLVDGLVFGTEDIGRGTVVYLTDNPLFRGFWENGKLLFSNAVFMVGN